jgi:hypothetical protein
MIEIDGWKSAANGVDRFAVAKNNGCYKAAAVQLVLKLSRRR